MDSPAAWFFKQLGYEDFDSRYTKLILIQKIGNGSLQYSKENAW